MSRITFLSDFGLDDEWVAVCKTILQEQALDAAILDITHGVPPFDVRRGAFLLAAAAPQIPADVHLAVVDPGVGGPRRGVVLATGRGDYEVGPDNGLLVPAAQRLGGIAAAYEIIPEKVSDGEPCPTFHARDIFAPAAALLAGGRAPVELASEIEPAGLAPAPWAAPKVEEGRIVCEVIDVDRFGTVRLAAEAGDVSRAGLKPGAALALVWPSGRTELPWAKTFADVEVESLVGLVDSSGYWAVAVNRGSAADRLGLRPGDSVEVRRAEGFR